MTSVDPDSEPAALIKTIERQRLALALPQPPGPHDRAGICTYLAWALSTLYETTREVPMIVEAISLEREALAVLSDGHIDRPFSHMNLACYLGRLHTRTEEVDVLDEAIYQARQSLQLQPPGYRHRTHGCTTLAVFLKRKYQKIEDITLLDEAIALQRDVLHSRPEHDSGYASSCVHFAYSILTHPRIRLDAELRDEAIALSRKALALGLNKQHESTACFSNLVLLLNMRYEQTSEVAILEELVALRRDALSSNTSQDTKLAELHSNLGLSLKRLYEVTKDLTLLHEAITFQRRAVSTCTDEGPYYVYYSSCLASSAQTLFNENNDISLLVESVELQRKALAVCQGGHSERARLCKGLAYSLHWHYEQTGDAASVVEAVALGREHLALCQPGTSDRATACECLARYLSTSFKRNNDLDTLDQAIALAREALELSPDGHTQRVTACIALAEILKVRHDHGGPPELVEEAITLEREAHAMSSNDETQHIICCTNLMYSLNWRALETGDAALLEEALVMGRTCVELVPHGRQGHIVACENLMSSLWAHFDQSGRLAVLDEATDLGRSILTMFESAAHPDRARCLFLLAGVLLTRHERAGDFADLNEALQFGRDALDVCPRGHSDRSITCWMVQRCLHAFYGYNKDSRLLDQAVALGREALASHGDGNLFRPALYDELALSLSLQMQNHDTRDVSLLQEVIKLERDALSLRPGGHAEHGLSCATLARSLWLLFESTEDAEALSETIQLCDEAIKTKSSPAVWRALLTLCRLHLHPATPHFSISRALACLQQCVSSEIDNAKDFMDIASSCFSLLWSAQRSWASDVAPRLAAVYTVFIEKLTLVAGFALSTSSQLVALKSAGPIGSDACIAALLGGRAAQAVELLEQAQGVIWSQALHQKDPQVEGAPHSLTEELLALLRATGTASRVGLVPTSQSGNRHLHTTPHDLRHRQNNRIQEILREIRAMPGLERFMLGHTFEKLRQVACGHAVVILVAARTHAFALIVRDASHEAPHPLRLDIGSDVLQRMRSAAQRAGLRNGDTVHDLDGSVRLQIRPSKHSAGRREEAGSLTVLSDLWSRVVKPVLDYLDLKPATGRARPRIHWCPVGDFVSLPLHAAGVYGGPQVHRARCSDYVVSSYTPTISALLRAQSKAPHTVSPHPAMLVVAESCHTHATMQTLWKVEDELKCVTAVASESKLGPSVDTIGSAATVAQVTDRIRSTHFVHLACHGIQHPTEALESGFYLSDGMLTVSQLMTLDLDRAWFAYLSACETAKGDASQPDQVVHLAAAMLFAGFKSVVATMWSMSDVDGPDMAEWFYEELLANETIDADAVAYALDAAVQKLREKMPLVPARWAPYIHMGA